MSPNRSPSGLDRIEASHWVRYAREALKGWLGCSERFDQFPAGTGSYQQWTADLDIAIERIELAKAALRGERTGRGATSLLQDLDVSAPRTPDVRPTYERTLHPA